MEEVAEDAQPILDMVVTDSRVDDAARPALLTFAGETSPVSRTPIDRERPSAGRARRRSRSDRRQPGGRIRGGFPGRTDG